MELAKTYGLDIPSTTLRGLLDKLEKEKYVNKQIRNKRRPDSHLYNLSEYGFLYSITYTGSEAKINNKIKDLFEDIKKFLTSKVEIDANIKLPENNDQVREIVIEYVHKNIASLLSMIYQDYAIDSFLFSWNEIPGKDNERITKYIDQEFNIDWIKNADIEKINDNEIRIFSGKNTISLNLNSEKTRVKININDVKTDLFQVKNGTI